jgi:hypothetical protein
MNFIINQNLLSIVGIAFGVIGIIVSVIMTLKSRVRVELYLLYESIPEIRKLSDKNRKIKVTYNNTPVDQVTTTLIWLINKGKKPLKREDIPQNDPLTINFISAQNSEEEIEILDFKVVKVSKESSNFNLSVQPKNTIILNFDYIDYMEGALFEVQHSGHKLTLLKLGGVLLGPKRNPKIIALPFQYNQKKKTGKFERIQSIVGIGGSLCFVCCFIVIAFIKAFINGLLVFLIFLSIFIILYLLWHRRRIPKQLQSE